MTSDNKVAHLNGAFYGPSIPSPTHHHALHDRRRRSCLCSLFCFLFKVLLALVLITGLAILVFWLIFRPTSNLKFHVTDASLTEFALCDNKTLKYNLIVSLTAYNPNERVGVHYKSLGAQAYYEDQRLGYLTLNVLDQGHNGTSVWRLVFKGQSFVRGDSDDDKFSHEFNDEKLVGVFPIDIRVSLRYKLRFGMLSTSTMKPKIACDLEVPLNNGNGFQTTKCGLKM